MPVITTHHNVNSYAYDNKNNMKNKDVSSKENQVAKGDEINTQSASMPMNCNMRDMHKSNPKSQLQLSKDTESNNAASTENSTGKVIDKKA